MELENLLGKKKRNVGSINKNIQSIIIPIDIKNKEIYYKYTEIRNIPTT